MLEDSARLTASLYGADAIDRLWSPRATAQRMLDVEAALAQALAAHRVIPAAAAAPIAAACRAGRIDADALARDAAFGGNLAIRLIKQMTARVKDVDPDEARYVHRDATSQDIIDTGLVLQLRDTFDVRDPLLRTLRDALAVQARAYRDTPMISRTWLQQALPITLGLKFAQWLDALSRHATRLVALRETALVLRLGGAAGYIDTVFARHASRS